MLNIRLNFMIAALSMTTIANASPQYLSSDVMQFDNTGICENCDLSNSKNLLCTASADLEGANLTNASFGGDACNLEKSIFSDAQMTSASVSGANLSSATFSNAYLEDTNFSNSDLSGVDFTGAIFKDVDFYFANLCHAQITQEQLDNSEMNEYTIMPNCHHYQRG